MNISTYNNAHGDLITHSVEFNEHFFPKQYVVRYNRGNPAVQTFPGTPKGAEDAERYYENLTNMCEKRNGG